MAPAAEPWVLPDLQVAHVAEDAGYIAWDQGCPATLAVTASGNSPVLRLTNQATGAFMLQCILTPKTAWRAGGALWFVNPLPAGAVAAGQSPSPGASSCYALRCPSTAASDQLQAALDAALEEQRQGGGAACAHAARGGAQEPAGDAQSLGSEAAPSASTPGVRGAPPSPSPAPSNAEPAGQRAGTGSPGPVPQQAVAAAGQRVGASPQQQQQQPQAAARGQAGAPHAHAHQQQPAGADCPDHGAVGSRNHFDTKIDKASADMYFHYYGMIMHQQNMLQDYTRTGTYYQAIVCNPADFAGKVVMDVGAGSGILSLFAAQAGAAKVYAVEASGMARFARMLADANPQLGSRIQVINSKVEEACIPEKVDVLVSEPMGTLLVNERMLETYLWARDAFLKPGGKMFPTLGRIHVAAFSDEALHQEVAAKAAFWLQNSFYGVDVMPLHTPALESYYAQVVVDAFDPSVLASSCSSHALDFETITERDLTEMDMPLQLMTSGVAPLTIHGLACWFDVYFNGVQMPTWLSTAPGLPPTHWFQLRCVLQQPLVVTTPGAVVTGRLRLVAHARQSYDIHLTLVAPPLGPGLQPQVSTGKFDLKEPYYRQLTPAGMQQAWAGAAGAAAGAGAAGGGGGWWGVH